MEERAPQIDMEMSSVYVQTDSVDGSVQVSIRRAGFSVKIFYISGISTKDRFSLTSNIKIFDEYLRSIQMLRGIQIKCHLHLFDN